MRRSCILLDAETNRETMAHIVLAQLDAERKAYERSEKYEHCAALRDSVRMMSDFLLGYAEWSAALDELVYYTCIKHGDYLPDEDDTCETYVLSGHYFDFDIITTKNKRKKK